MIDDDIFDDYNAKILSRLVKTSFDENGLDEKAKVKAISLLNSWYWIVSKCNFKVQFLHFEIWFIMGLSV